MNLMFWKRKTGAAEEAESAPGDLAVNSEPRESLDFSAAEQDSAGPESPVMDTDSAEPPAGPGLIARLKLRLATLAGNFRKAPGFRAEEDLARDAPDTEEEGDVADLAGEPPAPEAPAKPGLLVRIKAGFAAFTREFKASAAPAIDEDQEAGSRSRSEAAGEDELPLPEEEEVAEPVRSRKWLVVGGSITIAVLLLAHIAMANWPIFKEPQKRWGTRHDQTDIATSPRRPESGYEGSQAYAPPRSPAEVEALRQENAALQARVEALKKAPPRQQSYALPAGQAGGGSAPSPSFSGEIAVDTKDPKAAAMSLKEAIESMNAGPGDNGKKPAR